MAVKQVFYKARMNENLIANIFFQTLDMTKFPNIALGAILIVRNTFSELFRPQLPQCDIWCHLYCPLPPFV
jgi:hypothetical protein